jgi:hypothetical protein
MINTLLDYADNSFPGHHLEVSATGRQTALQLTSHTVVAHVVGTADAAQVAGTMQDAVGSDRVATVLVRPVEVSVLPHPREDSDGTFDLPNRRVGTAAAGGALVGAGAGFGVGILLSTATAAVIIAVFAAIVGGVLGAVSGGGARHAGERAVSQQQAPGRDIAVVAAFLEDEASATDLARIISAHDQQFDVRIVGADGAWHSPSN